MKDYYHILGVPQNAGPEEIKGAFRQLAFKHHSDKNPGNERQAEERFKEINEAYGVLGDEARRQGYNALLTAGVAIGAPVTGWVAEFCRDRTWPSAECYCYGLSSSCGLCGFEGS